MNCLEFRRACQADPHGLTTEHRAHRRDCPACARFADRQLRFDQRLEQAMRVEVPEGLGARVVFERSLRGRQRMRWMAAAALLLVSLAILPMVLLTSGPTGTAGALVAHLRVDPLQELPVDQRAPIELDRIIAEMGLAWRDHLPGRVVQAKRCEVAGHRGAHFVVQVGATRASAFVMPGMNAASVGRISMPGMPGLLVETDQGLIAVFCPDRSRLAALGEEVRRALSWSAA